MRIYIFSSKFYLPITAKAFKFAILKYYLMEVYITQGKLQLVNMNSHFFLPQLSIIFLDKVFISLLGKNKTKQNQNPLSMKQLQLLSLGGSFYRECFQLIKCCPSQSSCLIFAFFFFFQRNKSRVNLLTQSDKMSQLETRVFKSDFRQAYSLQRSSVLSSILHPDWFPPTMLQKNLCHDQT